MGLIKTPRRVLRQTTNARVPKDFVIPLVQNMDGRVDYD